MIVSSTSKAAQCSATQNYKKVTAQSIKFPFELSGYAGAVDLSKCPEEQYKLELCRPLFSTFYGGEMYNIVNPSKQEYIIVSLAKFK